MAQIVLAADHNGVGVKARLKVWLREIGENVIDLGPYPGTQSVDYVDYANQLGRIISNEEAGYGILICGTGVGMSIVANKCPGVRAALVHNRETAVKSREHNDSNVLCLGAWINSDDENLELTRLWLNQKFGEMRHVKRVERIDVFPKRKIVFANGCFDIITPGHVALLKFAKLLGDYLIVGLNSDESVRANKGDGRPINTQEDRRAVLDALQYVDEVVIFEELNPSNLINALRPDIVVRGGEHTAEEIRQRDNIPPSTAVKIFPLYKDYHSSKIIEQIRKG